MQTQVVDTGAQLPQSRLPLTDQLQSLRPLTLTYRVPPPAGNVTDVDDKLVGDDGHGTGCVTVNVAPATVSVAVRVDPAYAGTVQDTWSAPCFVPVSQLAELRTLPVDSPHDSLEHLAMQNPSSGGCSQSHVMSNVPEPPADEIGASLGDS